MGAALGLIPRLQPSPQTKFEFAVTPPTVQISLPKVRPRPVLDATPHKVHFYSKPRPHPPPNASSSHCSLPR